MRLHTADGLSLEAMVDEPAGAPVGGVVLCHPHPKMGGSMRAPLLEGVASKLADAGFRVLRFNTRGTGMSEGEFGGGGPEVGDLEAAWAALDSDAPRGLAGWSFGARLSMVQAAATGAPLVAFAPVTGASGGFPPLARPRGPVLAVVGDRDQYVQPAGIEEVLGVAPLVLPGCDHFFIGRFAEQAADAATDFFLRHLA